MTRAVDELQPGIGQVAGEPADGIEGYQGVPGVSEQQDRRLDRRDGVLELAELAEQGALLGQEGAPQRAVSAARVAAMAWSWAGSRAVTGCQSAGEPGCPCSRTSS